MEQLFPYIEENDAQQIPAPELQWQLQPETQLLSWKLQLAQSAMCHQYARMEYERTVCVIRREELQEEMGLYYEDYLEARSQLCRLNPGLLDEVEAELRTQKQLVFGDFHA